jgi:hypothetical protein
VIIKHLPSLIEDPYGNYLVQNVLKLNNAKRNDEIFKMIAKDFIRLSQLKFSSNVIEKCLESKQTDSQIDMILKGIHKEDDRTILKELNKQALVKQVRLSFIVDKLLFHQFGNYGIYIHYILILI